MSERNMKVYLSIEKGMRGQIPYGDENTDVIVVLDKGHIVERGCHEELMLKQGLYYHMCSQQLQVV